LAATLLASAAPVWSQTADLTITLTGQSMLRSDLRTTAPKAIPGIKSLLQGDVVFTNFEAAVAMPNQSVTDGGRGFLSPAESLDALTAMGFNVLSLSNNHAFDLKVTGIENTLREVEQRKIVHAGIGRTLADAGAPAYFEKKGVKFALVSSASGLIAAGGNATTDHPGVNELRIFAGYQPNEATADLPGAGANRPHEEDAQRILNSIREAKRHADIVIVYQHNHVFSNHAFSNVFGESLPERLAPNEWLKTWTHAEIDAGADIIVMHGAPLLHGIEVYKGKPILYDLGNFIFNVPPAIYYITEPMTWESVVAKVELKGKKLTAVTLNPIELNYVGDGQPDIHNQYASNEFLHTRGLPRLATGPKAHYILDRLSTLSMPFGTNIEVSGETARIKLDGDVARK
jgi:poly-gamma-glutamate synthesis protein (capsule biosynthesis protein)